MGIIQKGTGVVVSLYIENTEVNSRNVSDSPFLSWSPYDRIDIRTISKFGDFFLQQYSEEYFGHGIVQQMHLVVDSDGNDWTVNDGDDSTTALMGPCNRNYGVNCVIGLNFDEHINQNENTREAIYKTVADRMGEVDCEWKFCVSLGAEALVVLAVADSVSELWQLVDMLGTLTWIHQKETKKVFTSVNPICGVNLEEIEVSWKLPIMVRLFLRDRIYLEKAIQALEEEIPSAHLWETFLENGVIDIAIPKEEELFGYFRKDGIFNGNSSFYRSYVRSSRTYWIRKPDAKCEENCDVEQTPILLEIRDVPAEEHLNLETDVENRMSRFVLAEYKRLIGSPLAGDWESILKKQYTLVSDCLALQENEKNYEYIGALLTDVQAELLHIQQAIIPFSVTPSKNYTYSGSYSRILRSYYGIIETLLEIGYGIPKAEQCGQHHIHFGIIIEPIQDIYTTVYRSGDQRKRFVFFHLPYMSFESVGNTVVDLTHEVFHYIVPCDRKRTNTCIFEMYAIYVRYMVLNCMDNMGMQNETDLLNKDLDEERVWIDKGLHDEILDAVSKHFGDYEKIILDDVMEFDMASEEMRFEVIGGMLGREMASIWITKIVDFLGQTEESLQRMFGKVSNSKERQRNDEKKRAIKEAINYSMRIHGSSKTITSIRLEQYVEVCKEVLCDINMLEVCEGGIKGYIQILKRRILSLVEGYSDTERIDVKDIIDRMEWKLRTRVGCVFDYFYYDKSREKSEQALMGYFVELEKDDKGISDNDKSLFKTIYSHYLQDATLYRHGLVQIFEDIKDYWNSCDKTDEAKTRLELCREMIQTEQTDIWRYMELLLEFSTCEVMRAPDGFSVQKDDDIKSVTIVDKGESDMILPFRRQICSVSEYIECVNEVVGTLMLNADCKNKKQEEKSGIWYRGECSITFTTIPNLLRGFKNIDGGSLYTEQVRHMKRAYRDTASFPDLWTRQLKTIPEHLCFLQHYGSRTNLLDFSTNMLVALLFAVDPDVKEDKNKLKDYKYTPRVILFSPEKYNDAVNTFFKYGYTNRNGYTNVYPVAFGFSNEELKGYFVNEMSPEYCRRRDMKYMKNPLNANWKVKRFPRPVIIRRSNDRVLAQEGTFLAYDLNTKPEYVEKENLDNNQVTVIENDYSYLSVQRIQEKYENLLGLQGDSILGKEFYQEIYVDRFSVFRIREELDRLGIRKSYVYPEFSSIISESRDI